jgi:hypothetical protein
MQSDNNRLASDFNPPPAVVAAVETLTVDVTIPDVLPMAAARSMAHLCSIINVLSYV